MGHEHGLPTLQMQEHCASDQRVYASIDAHAHADASLAADAFAVPVGQWQSVPPRRVRTLGRLRRRVHVQAVFVGHDSSDLQSRLYGMYDEDGVLHGSLGDMLDSSSGDASSYATRVYVEADPP
jgi:hypothetical protein